MAREVFGKDSVGCGFRIYKDTIAIENNEFGAHLLSPPVGHGNAHQSPAADGFIGITR